jgi:hypothetical protein
LASPSPFRSSKTLPEIDAPSKLPKVSPETAEPELKAWV